MLHSLRRLARDQDGAATVEFVVIFLAFISVMFFVVEVALYMFFIASLEKAAEVGVRAAVVSSPVAPGVPATIEKDPAGIYGRKCSLGGQCVPFATASCTGATCTAGDFNRILNHMKGFNAGITAENVTITYQDVGIGFAGGPTVPMITVAISGVPYQTGIFSLLLGPGGTGALGTLPSRSASMTGEDLAP